MALSPTSSRGSGSSSSGALTQLYNLVRATDGTFDQSGISAAYNDLIIQIVVQSDRGGGNTIDQIFLRFNNDSAARYGWQQASIAATSLTATQANTTNQIQVGDCNCVANATQFSMYEILVPGYSSATWWKTCTTTGTYPFAITSGGIVWDRNSGVYNQTTAISRIQIFPSLGTNWKAGSYCNIYGRL